MRSALAEGMTPGEIDRTVRERAAAGLPLYDLDRDALREAAPRRRPHPGPLPGLRPPGHTVTEALDELGLGDVAVHSFDPHTLDEVLTGIDALAPPSVRTPRPCWTTCAPASPRSSAPWRTSGTPAPRLEWTDPPFLPGHWVPELVRRAGATPTAGIDGGRSTTVAWEELEPPETIVVTPCGYDLDAAVEQAGPVVERFPGVPVVAVDSAAYVVRAGPRLVDGIEALAHALHPDVMPAPPAGRVARVA